MTCEVGKNIQEKSTFQKISIDLNSTYPHTYYLHTLLITLKNSGYHIQKSNAKKYLKDLLDV